MGITDHLFTWATLTEKTSFPLNCCGGGCEASDDSCVCAELLWTLWSIQLIIYTLVLVPHSLNIVALCKALKHGYVSPQALL